jgi:5-methylcytosine-specific restriction endonuclease McrA
VSSVISLLNQIKNDEIVLPGIQRDFVWPPDKIIRLLDSMLRGYPVGIVLLWETYGDIQYRSFVKDYRPDNAFTYSENTQRKRIKLVLDGQQRLQSLYIALYGTYQGKLLYFDVLSGKDADDLSEDRFLFHFLTVQRAQELNDVAKDKKARGHLVHVGQLFTMSAVARKGLEKQLTAELALADEDSVRLGLNLSRFEDALSKDESILKVSTIDENLPNDSPYRKSEADVLEIFVRINREGTPLSRSDLVFSMLKLNWRESAEALPDFVRKVNQGNSFDLDTDFVVRCLFAVSDLGTRVELDTLRRKSNVDALRRNFQACCEAIAAAVDFLVTKCWSESSLVLGGSNTFVPLVYYLFRSPNREVPNDQLDNLRRVVLLFAFARPFSRYADSRLGAYIRSDMKPVFDGGGRQLDFEKARVYVRYWERVGSLGDLIEANQLLTLHLVQRLTGAKVQYLRNSPEIDHIFPRSILREKGFDEEEVNDVANFWILAQHKNRNKSNQHPKQYFADVSDKELERALIDRTMLDYRQYRSFLKWRKEAMTKRLRRMLDWPEELAATGAEPK